jgi:hypothetical protein
VTLSDRSHRQLLWGILLLGLGLRLAGLNWDAGRGLHPDEGNLLRAAAALRFPEALIPSFHAYNDLALWLPRLLAWPFCEAQNLACLGSAARLVSAGFAIATVPLAALLARQIAGPAAALATAFAFATSAPLIQWAHFGTTESALVFFVLALWTTAALWHSGRLGDRQMALISALLLGTGFGMKTTAAAFALIPLVAFALAGRPDRTRLLTLATASLLALALALITTPSLWLATTDWLAVMRYENAVVQGSLPVFWTAQFNAAPAGWYQLGQLWRLLSGSGLILAAAGLVLMPRPARKTCLPALAFALIYAAITFGWHAKFIRYLAPLLPILLVLAGCGAARLLALRSQSLAALAGAGLGLMALAGLDQAAGYLQTDPRLRAEAELIRRAHPQDLVAIEPNDLGQTGPLQRLTLPLDQSDAAPLALAEPLAQARWLLIASRRNWAVLPETPDRAPLACGFYAALAQGKLGYSRAFKADRNGPFGSLFAPSLASEETRVVFDRPEVLLFYNQDALAATQIAEAIAAAQTDPVACRPDRLDQSWQRLP